MSESKLPKVGDTFAGCHCEQAILKEDAYVWIFSRDNHAVIVSIPISQYMDALLDHYLREEMLDSMAKFVYKSISFKGKIMYFDQKGS